MKTGVIFEHMLTDNYFIAERQRPVHVPERRAALDPAAHDAVSGAGSDRRAGHVRPGSVADQPSDASTTACDSITFDGYTPSRRCRALPTISSTTGSRAFRRSTPGSAARTFEAVDGIPNWKDIDPRFGVSYDLFGNGRTALKFAIGRYVAKTNVDVAVLLNPNTTAVNTASRSWTDANTNYYPDCDLGNFGQNGECGAISDQNFGKQNPEPCSGPTRSGPAGACATTTGT